MHNPVDVPVIQIYFMLQFIQLPKIHLKKLHNKAIMKKLNLNICVHCYHHPSHPQPLLKSSFASLMLFHELNEINYFHILQTLHCVCGCSVPFHVHNQLTWFVLQMSRPWRCSAASPGFSCHTAERRRRPRSDETPSPLAGRCCVNREGAPVTVLSCLHGSPLLFWESARRH